MENNPSLSIQALDNGQDETYSYKSPDSWALVYAGFEGGILYKYPDCILSAWTVKYPER